MDEKKEDNTSIKVAEVDVELDPVRNEAEFLEVQAGTVIDDDETMVAETFRAYFIGIILTGLGAVISNITSLREEPLTVEPSIIQLVALPIGRLWARWMPVVKVPLGPWSLNLNPGPFTVKEHTLITMMANVGVGYPPYCIDLIIAQIMKYGISFFLGANFRDLKFGFFYNFTLIMGSELIGYGFAGLCRRWLVYPPDMIWPSVLQTSNFLNTMHRDVNNPVGRWTISRYKLFFIAAIACFGYSFLPQFLPFMSDLDIFTILWPKSKIVNLLFGRRRGLALLPMTLSWQTVIAFLGTSYSVLRLTVREPSSCSSLCPF
jgi:OPT family oligopeptide transporter